MQNAAPVQLQKYRDLGQLITSSFQFLKQNWKPLFRAIGVICLPIGMVAGFLMGRSATDLENVTGTVSPTGFSYSGTMANDLPMFIGYFLLVLVMVMLMAIVYEYMRMYHAGEHAGVTTADLWKRTIAQFGPYLAMTFFYYVLVLIGSLLCVLPGIYAMVAFSLIYMVHAIERKGAFASFNRSLHLIKERWWETFGLMLVVGMIQMTLIYALMIPVMIISFVIGLNSNDMGVEGAEAMQGTMMVIMAITMTLYIVAILLIYPLMAVALGLKYFSIVEEKEGVGIRQRIQGFEQA